MELQLKTVGITHGGEAPHILSVFRLTFVEFNKREAKEWMEHHWTVCLYFIVPYCLFISYGLEYMRNRRPMNLKWAMTLWNFSLAIFSVLACCTVLPEFYRIISSPNGFHNSVCAPCSVIPDQSLKWGWLFTLSKLVELLDTVWLVLKNRKVIFLHWFHHITVLLYCWYSYSFQLSSARWFICVNFFIHAMMYTYYGLRAQGVHIPRQLAMTLTCTQLSQMLIGVVVNVYAYRMKTRGVECDMPLKNIYLGFLMYASYFVLFAHFFYKAYMNGGISRTMKAHRKVE